MVQGRTTGGRRAAVAGSVAALVLAVGASLTACGQPSKGPSAAGAGPVAATATGTTGATGTGVTPDPGATASSGFDYVAVTSTGPGGSSSSSASGSPASVAPPPPGPQQGAQPSSAPAGGTTTSRPNPPATTAPTAKPPASTAPPPPATSAKPPTTTAPPPAPPSSATPKNISGTVSCVSGKSVEGVWVQASKGSGYAPWQGIGNGSTSKYWYTLPDNIQFALHVGCGGTQDSWGVAANSPNVNGPVVNFTCYDVSGQAKYGTCEPQ